MKTKSDGKESSGISDLMSSGGESRARDQAGRLWWGDGEKNYPVWTRRDLDQSQKSVAGHAVSIVNEHTW